MTKQQKTHEVTRLRTEIAFKYGDSCHGGPNTKDIVEDLKQQLAEVLATKAEDEE